jgi:hypothetical protein
LLAGDVAHAFFDQILAQARERDLLSDEHFTVDGTLIEAWAGQKSFRRKSTDAPSPPPDDPRNPGIDFRGERRTNATHASTTDPDARLYKKAKLCYPGHVLIENPHGLVVGTRVTQATGTTGRLAALAMAAAIPGPQRVTLGADKNYDTRDVVRELRVTPHMARPTTGRSSAIDGRTTRHPGDVVSQRKRKCVEEIFRVDENGWATAEDATSRSSAGVVDVHLCSSRTQPGTDADAGSRGMSPKEDRNAGLLCPSPC